MLWSLLNQRLYYPKWKISTTQIIISWALASRYFWSFFGKSGSLNVFCGSFLDLKSAFFLKKFLNSFGCSNIFSLDNPYFDNFDFRFYFQLNSTLDNIESLSNILFFCINPRLEMPLLNSRFRKAYLKLNNFMAYSIGFSLNFLTYPVENVINNFSYIFPFFEGKIYFLKYILLSDFSNLYFFSIICRSLDIFVGSSVIVNNTKLYTKNIMSNLISLISLLKLSFSNLHFIFSKIGFLSLLEFGMVKNLSYYVKNFMIGQSFIFVVWI